MSSRRSRSGGTRIRDVQPVEQISPEEIPQDQILQIAMRRRDQPHIQPKRLAAPQPRDHRFVEKPQQLGLRRGGKFADFIEKERAGVGFLKSPGTLRSCAGEGPLFKAEQFGFNERFGQGRGIDGDKRMGGAGHGREWRGRPAPCRCRFLQAPAPAWCAPQPPRSA